MTVLLLPFLVLCALAGALCADAPTLRLSTLTLTTLPGVFLTRLTTGTGGAVSTRAVVTVSGDGTRINLVRADEFARTHGVDLSPVAGGAHPSAAAAIGPSSDRVGETGDRRGSRVARGNGDAALPRGLGGKNSNNRKNGESGPTAATTKGSSIVFCDTPDEPAGASSHASDYYFSSWSAEDDGQVTLVVHRGSRTGGDKVFSVVLKRWWRRDDDADVDGGESRSSPELAGSIFVSPASQRVYVVLADGGPYLGSVQYTNASVRAYPLPGDPSPAHYSGPDPPARRVPWDFGNRMSIVYDTARVVSHSASCCGVTSTEYAISGNADAGPVVAPYLVNHPTVSKLYTADPAGVLLLDNNKPDGLTTHANVKSGALESARAAVVGGTSTVSFIAGAPPNAGHGVLFPGSAHGSNVAVARFDQDDLVSVLAGGWGHGHGGGGGGSSHAHDSDSGSGSSGSGYSGSGSSSSSGSSGSSGSGSDTSDSCPAVAPRAWLPLVRVVARYLRNETGPCVMAGQVTGHMVWEATMTYTPSFASQFEITLAVDGCGAARRYDPSTSLVETAMGVRAIISSSNGVAAGHCRHVVDGVLSILSDAASLVPPVDPDAADPGDGSAREIIGGTGARFPGGLALAATAVGCVVASAVGYIIFALGRAKSAAEAQHERFCALGSVSAVGGPVNLSFGPPPGSDGDGDDGSDSSLLGDLDSGCDEDIVVFVEHGEEESFSDGDTGGGEHGSGGE